MVDSALSRHRCSGPVGDHPHDDQDAFAPVLAHPHLITGPDRMRGLDPHPDDPDVPAHRIEAAIVPTNDGGIYYTGPSDDWSRPGRMWWSVPDGVEAFSTWKEVTVVYHEGVPAITCRYRTPWRTGRT